MVWCINADCGKNGRNNSHRPRRFRDHDRPLQRNIRRDSVSSGNAGTACDLCNYTRAEVLTGFEGKERQLARRLLDRFPTLIIDLGIADLAATLRRQNRWKMPDALQAAVAKNHKLKFATRDTDDFPPRRYRFVTVPYTI